MKHEKSLINTLFGKVFPMFENAENLTDPRRNGRPEIDRFAGVLSVLAYDAHKGVFLLNAGGRHRLVPSGACWKSTPFFGPTRR